MQLQNSVIVITGAASGIGRAMAQQLSVQGAKLALIDREQASLLALSDSLPDALPISMNITDENQVDEGFARIVEQFGKIDVLLNNAGVLRDGLLIKVKDGEVSQRLPVDTFRSVIDVNLTGTFLCGRAAASHMAVQKSGVIVNVSSVARAGNKGQRAYAASKAGVVALTTTWANELCDFGIRVAAIAPGFIDTPMIQQMRPDMLQKMVTRVPSNRVASLDEIGHALRFIIENDYFNGRVLELDGGLRF